MSIDAFIQAVQQQGVNLWLDEQGQLRFKARAGAMTPTLQGELKARKGELVAFLAAQASDAALPTLEPDPDNRYQPFPLTDIQEAYWVGRSGRFELNTPSHFYDEFAVQGLDPERLAESWRHLVERHEALRTIVLPSGEQQILAAPPRLDVACFDLREGQPDALQQHLGALRQEMLVTPFVPQRWPLHRLCLSLLPQGEVRIHLALDMLIADWGSLGLLLDEWGELYHHPERPLAPLALSFRDYVLAERRLHETALYARAKAYWEARLDHLPAAPELPLALDPEQLTRPIFSSRRTLLDATTWGRLKEVAKGQGVTATVLLLAAFAEVLSRWSKQPHFAINLTLFNRLELGDMAQIHKLVGDFTSVNLLEVDNRAADESLAQRTQRLQQRLWSDMEQRVYSAVRVMRALSARRQGAPVRMPVIFTSGVGLAQRDEWLGEPVHGFSQTPQVWLDCQVGESQGRLRVVWDVVDDLFPAGMVDAMYGAFLDLLRRLAIEPALWTATSPELLPEAQRATRARVNATEAPIAEARLHELFLAQARLHGARPAVITPLRRLDYAELAREAALVAHWLHDLGVGRNQLVGVVMEKGWEQVVAVLGVQMAGAAYVPIDPDQPTERLHYILDQAQARAVLTQPWVETAHPWPTELPRLAVAPPGEGTPQVVAPPAVQGEATDLAYVIYTSGSTGSPKGVVIDHRGAVNTVLDINRRYGVGPDDRVLALSALNFDLSVYDIFGLLAAGGALVMPLAEARRDPSQWAELMQAHGVTLWNTVPALMAMLVEYLGATPLDAPLGLVMLSGDWIPLELPERIRALFPNARRYSLGGATEASIWSNHFPIERIEPQWKSIPYGVPLTNQYFRILNARLDDCPDWVPGQLCIGGVGVALGYWRDEERTNAQFFTHPRSGERLYNTGDLGRYLPDGNIEFLGREDFQVKISGYRIELGEIESQLLRHPAVASGVVAAVGASRSDKQLVAYYVPTEAARTAQRRQSEDLAYMPEAAPGLITEATERMQFRLAQPGRLRSLEGRAEVALEGAGLDDAAYLRRQSFRHFLDQPVALPELGRLLGQLQPRQFEQGVLPKYRYGSAGSLYPVQCYLYIKPGRVTGLAGGYYYHDPLAHRLLQVGAGPEMERAHYDGGNRLIFDQAAFVLFLVADYRAIEPLYGTHARDFCLLEAGYISQLLMMEAGQYQLGLCPIGLMNFAQAEALALDPQQEMVHSFLGGAIASEQMARLSQASPALEPLAQQLRKHLAEHLPGYMVPSAIVELDAIPLSANGKVDRKALPLPEVRRTHATAPRVERALSETEQRLAGVVGRVLGVASVGLDDRFFDLGADSLAMVQIYNAVQAEFRRELTIGDIFDQMCVAALAPLIDAATPLAEVDTASDDGEASLDAADIDRLSANLENLSDDEVERLLAQFGI